MEECWGDLRPLALTFMFPGHGSQLHGHCRAHEVGGKQAACWIQAADFSLDVSLPFEVGTHLCPNMLFVCFPRRKEPD